jgi:pimeloyl-ACP methyl ester carboxylesterase
LDVREKRRLRTVSPFDNTGREDVLSGGVRMIPIETPAGTFNVWTKRTGNNPKIKVLLLHGGPGATHEYLQAFDSFFPGAGIEHFMPEHCEKHILRMPAAEWPNPVHRAFAALNYDVYLRMQGPSELGASGKILNWDRTADLSSITVSTLVIGARYDSMDPKHMEWMAEQFRNGSYLYCAEGSHLAMYDDQETYFRGVIGFLRALDS